MTLASLVSRLRSGQPVTDAELERADRRAFLRGFTVTAAGLLLPVPIISVAPAETLTFYSGWIMWNGHRWVDAPAPDTFLPMFMLAR